MTPIPYGKQSIDEDDIQAVIDVLRSDWLTTGPKVEEFEKVFAETVGAKYAVAVSSGTAALHAAMFVLRIGPGDEVIVSPMTFAASANCIVYQGGTPVFADVEPDTLLIDPTEVEKKDYANAPKQSLPLITPVNPVIMTNYYQSLAFTISLSSPMPVMPLEQRIKGNLSVRLPTLMYSVSIP